MNFYIYTTSSRDAKKVLNYLKNNNIQHESAIFSEADNILGFTNIHIIKCYLTDADIDKYLPDLEDFRLSVSPC